ncbi:acyltransferase [Neorhizobium sp. P12A]|uniref:acyltransferase family protein n=1 Tax=Neorhizobium sp. P12A TaxID=2268027 RepID=UPI0011EBF2A8|nr:acyltransferase [Neorhizobium sp. P12A]KAA0698662.1 acyltransferase [Neorhizobium sp. P12A]
MKTERETRLAGADFIRTLACLLVLAHHLVLRLDVSKVDGALRPAFELTRFGNYGVALFFVLSGFLLARPFWTALDRGTEMPSLKAYALRRAARILPGFWIALTVGFVLSFTVYDFPLDAELAGRYVAGFLLMSQWHWRTFFPVQGDGPLWSIPFETTCYVLLPLCFAVLFHNSARLSRQTSQCLAWLGIIGLVLLCHWLTATYAPIDDVRRGWDFGFQGGAKEWMPRYNPIGFFAIFATGALASGIHTWLPAKRSVLYDILGFLALIAGAAQFPISIGGPWEGYGWLGIPYRFPFLPLAVAAALCTLPRSVYLGKMLDNPIVRYIATISFGIYIWQDIVISLIKQIFPGSFGGARDVLSGWIASSILAVVLLLLIATVSYFFLERPIILWARNLEGRTQLRSANP